MNLSDISQRIKSLPDLPKDIAVVGVILACSVGGYLIGRLEVAHALRDRALRVYTRADAVSGEVGITRETPDNGLARNSVRAAPAMPQEDVGGSYVGSRTGKTYHLPWCSGAQRIKPENRVWFATKGEAEERGYHPAVNCKGI
jgi:hypothetical protein